MIYAITFYERSWYIWDQITVGFGY
jgi:hypothetical protein